MPDMSENLLEIALIFLLVFINGLLATAEIALVSSRKAKLQVSADEGSKGARTALKLVENPSRLLATVQVGITMVGIINGALGGATLSDPLAHVLAQVPFIAPASKTIAVLLVVVFITYISLVMGELIPKRLALSNPERLSIQMAPLMSAIAWLNSPLVRLLGFSTDVGLKLMGIDPKSVPSVSEDELKVLLRQGTQEGVFEEAEQDMVEGVFRLSDRSVSALLTPRTEIIWLDLDEPHEVLMRRVAENHHTRFPVGQGSLDNVLGILEVKDLIPTQAGSSSEELRSLLHPALFIPESTPALEALEMLKKSRDHLALVIDEFGGLLGMVTLVDILGSIVGEISSAGQHAEPPLTLRADGSYLIDGLFQVDELKEVLELEDLPEEDRVGYLTVGGLVMSQLGAIPTSGQAFDWKGWRFEVIDMDGRRVDKILVRPLEGKNE